MTTRLVSADALRQFVEQVFLRTGYTSDQAVEAADVLMWASLRGVDTHGVRNLKSYYVDRTLEGTLRPAAEVRVVRETPSAACLDGDSGLGLTCARHAMQLTIEKCRSAGMAMVCVRNTHHLGPAGYYAHMAVEHGMIGMCATGHFFGQGHWIGMAPPGSLAAMLSTNPLAFAAPCGRHGPFVLDMATAVATVNRLEIHGQEGRPIPAGWAEDTEGKPTTDPTKGRLLLPLGGTSELGGHKGAGLGMMVSVLSGVLSGAWASLAAADGGDEVAENRYDQPTMGHAFAAVRIDAFQPVEAFCTAMDAMIDALHAAPTKSPEARLCHPGEQEFATAALRREHGIPISDFLFDELCALGERLDVALPVCEVV
jgi:LDH2 family malate/lactate/ureidoglycolate dehydrogenase